MLYLTNQLEQCGTEAVWHCLQVWFSEVSPRPHDTGMVTMISQVTAGCLCYTQTLIRSRANIRLNLIRWPQDMPQFAIHARAILGLPVTTIRQHGPSASAAILAEVSELLHSLGGAECCAG